MRCVYVAIGQKGSTIAGVKQSLEEAGAMEYTTIVAAPASDPAGYKYISAYTGSAIGQHWMYEGKHVLIVFDDLSKQAEAYRTVSLLLRRPPGREAYPGDVFYLHSRLLERCAKLSDELGGGSMTGLPIIETKGNDISAYIPTNVISITDGQIFLETDLFNSGVRPAINVGQSVSRVGGAAQVKAMKKVAGQLRLSLSQFRDLEAFAAFASDLDAASRAQLDRGARLVELLKQPQYDPFPVEEEVVSIWAGTTGQLDDVPVEDVRRFETEFIDYLRRSYGGLLTAIRETKDLTDDNVTTLKDAMGQFRRTFEVTGGKLLVSDDDEPVAPLGAGELGQESVAKYDPRLSRLTRGPGRLDGRRVGAMAAQLRAVRARIRAVKSIAKITRAQELIASSRIVRAQQRTRAAEPYARELTTAVEAVVSRSSGTITHPMITEPRDGAAVRGVHHHQRRRVLRRLQRQRAARVQPAPRAQPGERRRHRQLRGGPQGHRLAPVPRTPRRTRAGAGSPPSPPTRRRRRWPRRCSTRSRRTPPTAASTRSTWSRPSSSRC